MTTQDRPLHLERAVPFRAKVSLLAAALITTYVLALGASVRAGAPAVDDWISDFTGSPLYPSQLGKPGFPGMGPDGPDIEPWGFPERIPYPGAVEHVRVYIQRYIPVVPVYNTRTLVKNYLAAQLPGLAPERVIDYAEPIYAVMKYDGERPTGRSNKPVKVVRWDKASPPIELDLGTLAPSVYVLRIIAATPTEHVERASKRLVINCEFNDDAHGAMTLYRKRCAAIDEFYSIVEFFLLVAETRTYRARLSVDASTVLPELYLHNVDLHDKLAQLANRPGKRSAALYDAAARAAEWKERGTSRADTRSPEARAADDAKAWSTYVPLNGQPFIGFNPITSALHSSAALVAPKDAKDDGLGIDIYGENLFWKQPREWLDRHANARGVAPLLDARLRGRLNFSRQTAYIHGAQLGNNLRNIFQQAVRLAGQYDNTGDEVVARRATMYLAQVALLNMVNGYRQCLEIYDMIPGFAHGDSAFRGRYREMNYELRGQYGENGSFVTAYDQLFPFIQGNQELAAALGRYVPWVKSANDMHKFFDVFICQNYAHQIMNYNVYTDDGTPAWMSNVIAVQQDAEIVQPWIDWLFRYAWVYPNRPAGLDELAVNTVNRDGTSNIGSTYYTQGGSFLDSMGRVFADFKKGGGKMPVDITDTRRFPKGLVGGRFQRDISVAGGYLFMCGDVCCPTRPRLQDLGPELRNAPERIPANPSRVLANWAGILETGQDHVDFRLRRAVGIRVGSGWGHSHHDPLDLQIWSQGVPMCGDGGARAGYAVPATSALLSHNTVVSSLAGTHGGPGTPYTWICTHAPLAGAQYMRGSVRCDGVYERQVALVDVDGANSYVVDVFRIRGGDAPAYAFHGMPADQFEVNAVDRRRAELPDFRDEDSKWTGTAPAELLATWRMRRMEETVTWTDKAGKSGSLRAASTERMALGPDFDAATPRKFIRMHLPGHAGDEVYGARALNRQGDTYTLDMLYVKPRQWTPESATIFPVVFEPFGGSPFIKSVRLLTPEASLKHASSSVAIEVVTFGGRRDVICMAGRQSPAATLEGMTFHGEYAMVSFDEKGLRQAALAAGTKLDVKDLTITTDRTAYEGTVKSIDYDARTAELSAPLPKEAANAVIEVGSTGRPTTYTLTSAEGTRVAFDKGMDLYMSHVVEFNAEGLPVLQMAGTLTGGLTATDDNCKTWWKLAADPGTPSEGVRLEQGPAAQGALTTGDALRVWEIGPGDAYRLPVVINIVRQAGGEFRTVANAPVTVRPAESGKGTHTNPTR